MPTLLTQAELQEWLHYSPETGLFTWIKKPNQKVVVGRVAGKTNARGVVCIRLKTVSMLAHRMVWLYVHGHWPKCEIDHIDGDPNNNRLSNLRDVSHTVNAQNVRRVRASRTNGLPQGVTITTRNKTNRFVAQLGVEYATLHLGYFPTPEAAHQAYLDAKRVRHEGCTI